MNGHDLVFLGFMLFIAGIVFGVAATMFYRDTMTALEKELHQKTIMEQGQEIARLRAQVALHIGKEQ